MHYKIPGVTGHVRVTVSQAIKKATVWLDTYYTIIVRLKIKRLDLRGSSYTSHSPGRLVMLDILNAFA